MTIYRRGTICLANLNPGKKSEPGKVRPVLILQSDLLNEAGHPSTIVVPLTTNLVDGLSRLRYRLTRRGKLERDSDLLLDQIRAIDNARFTSEPLTELNSDELVTITQRLVRLIEQ